jgi:hypothetical protein
MNTQVRRNPKFFNNNSIPDTDSRGIELNTQGALVTINLMYDHSRSQYTVPYGDSSPVTIAGISNAEERSLHTLVLNNAPNATSKVFTFSSTFVFLDSATVITSVTVPPGKVAVYFGCVIAGKLFLRSSVESTA